MIVAVLVADSLSYFLSIDIPSSVLYSDFHNTSKRVSFQYLDEKV
jgi:hypothetical protein